MCVYIFELLMLKIEYMFIFEVVIEEDLFDMYEVSVGFVVVFFVFINGVDLLGNLKICLCVLIFIVVIWEYVVVYGMFII